MQALISLLWSLCRLQKGPQDIPHSWSLLAFFLLFDGLMGWYQISHRADFATSLLLSALMLVVMTVFTFLVLLIKGYVERFVQTLTALLGVNAVINLIIYPLIILTPFLLDKDNAQVVWASFSLILVMTLLALNVWLVIITANIYRLALNVTFLVGLLVTIALLGSNAIIFAKLMPK